MERRRCYPQSVNFAPKYTATEITVDNVESDESLAVGCSPGVANFSPDWSPNVSLK